MRVSEEVENLSFRKVRIVAVGGKHKVKSSYTSLLGFLDSQTKNCYETHLGRCRQE